MAENETEKKCNCAELMSGIGTLLTGIAAVVAVFIGGNYISSINNNHNSNTTTVIINPCKASEEAEEIIKESNNPESLDRVLSAIPYRVPSAGKTAAGLVIAPEYRAEVKRGLLEASSKEDKVHILESFWQKSLPGDVQEPVKLDVNGSK